MNDSYSETNSTSWFSRLGNSIKGILVGLVLVIVAFPLLFWNEGRAVARYKTLKEGAGAVIPVSSADVLPDNEGKLVHVSGLATSQETLRDTTFGVEVPAIKLKRTVEMYQWREVKSSESDKKLGGSTETKTTYTYDKLWSKRLIDSASFKVTQGHQNPSAMEFVDREKTATQVTLGVFSLSPAQVSRINSYQPLELSLDQLPEELRSRVKKSGEAIFFGDDPASPKIGDLRVSFQYVPNTQISLVAQQVGNSFGSYASKAGGSISLLQVGVHAADSMFQRAQASNTALTWALRVVGFFIMAMGLSLILKPLTVLTDVLPFLGVVVGAGISFVSFAFAAILSLLTIAVAWFFYRPLLSVGLLVLAGGIAFWFRQRAKAEHLKPGTPKLEPAT